MKCSIMPKEILPEGIKNKCYHECVPEELVRT